MLSNGKELYAFQNFRLDVGERLLLRDGERIQLPEKAFEILCILIRRNGTLIGKDELLAEVWRDTIVEENNLDKNVSILRKALGRQKGEDSFIETVRGHGYRFVREVERHRPDENGRIQAEAALAKDSINRHPGPTHARKTDLANTVVALADWKHKADASDLPQLTELPVTDVEKARPLSRNRLFAAGLLVPVFLLGGLWLTFRSTTTPGNADLPIKSIAVLPFQNETGDSDIDYLSEGVPESLINRLSQLPGMKVIARNSTFKYKDKNADLQDVANALGVEAILSGRVSQRGENILINVELVDVRDKTQLWGEQYNRTATDLLNVQSEISHEIAEKLRLRLTAGEQKQLARRETANPDAYEFRLKGRFYWNKGGTENRKKATEFYQQAIAADPGYALAYADLSNSYHFLVWASILDPKEYAPRAEGAARKALELDDGLAEAHLANSEINLVATSDWEAAEREFKRAIELSPNLAGAHLQYSYYLTFLRRHDEAIAEAKRAKELDPISSITNYNVGFQLLMAHQTDRAIEAAKKTLELDQNYPEGHALLGYIYAAREQFPDAIAAYHTAIKLGDDSRDTLIYLGAAYAKAGERAKAQAVLRKLETGNEYVSPGSLADLYVALGENERAFAALEQAYAARDPQLLFLSINPNLDSLRSDPRFIELMKKMNFER